MQQFSLANTQINYFIKRSKKAKRIRIIISGIEVQVVVPYRVKYEYAHNFVIKKADWINKVLHKASKVQNNIEKIEPGKILYRGIWTDLEIIYGNVIKPTIFSEGNISIHFPAYIKASSFQEKASKILRDWLLKNLEQDIKSIVDPYAKKIGLAPKNIRIKRQKSLWGSCSTKGNINLNFGLIFAPYTVLEYVILHELCHLRHHNHSKAFWNLVALHMPNYKINRKWLKDNQRLIHLNMDHFLTNF